MKIDQPTVVKGTTAAFMILTGTASGASWFPDLPANVVSYITHGAAFTAFVLSCVMGAFGLATSITPVRPPADRP